jgi:cell division protein FtsL
MKPMLLVGAILLLGLLIYVWQHVQVVRSGYQERLRAARATLIQEGKALRVELGRLRSLKRVEEIARGKLGMVNPVPGQIVFMEEPP